MLRAMPPLVSRINVVYLYVRDLDRSVAFYRDVLGLPIEKADEHWADARLDGLRFALHTGERVEPGTVWIDFEVDDVDAAAEHLRAAGVEVGEINREPYGSFCDFVDPDGYRLELFQPPG
jgi:lactoylglutathione lyase